MTDADPAASSADALARPFGAASRAEMLGRFLGSAQIAPTEAWKTLYKLLLWIDRTTGLAHCYESDKAQPGRPWYARSMVFHAWVAEQLGVSPVNLSDQIDWLFREGSVRLSVAEEKKRADRTAAAREQRSLVAEGSMPEPGDDPVLREIFQGISAAAHGGVVPDHKIRSATAEVTAHMTAENRRRNLLGEAFEDALAELVRRLPGGGPPAVQARQLLHELPGFRQPPGGEKPRRVDLGIVTAAGRRLLLSLKWSVRADREEQFGVDFDAYARMEATGEDFDFVLVTNEFDAARLRSAVQRRTLGRPLFDEVVHVCPDAVLATYGDGGRGAAAELPALVETGRIRSLGAWLASLI